MNVKTIFLGIIGVLAAISMAAHSEAVAGASQTSEYVLWVGSSAPGRADHEAQIIQQALERTVDSHGPFKLTVSRDSYSGRWRQVLAEGEQIQVVPTSLMDFPPAELTLIPVPIAGGKLGYRNLVVRKHRLQEFTNIRGAPDLAKFTAGQGLSWPDMWVYEANDLPIEGGNNMRDLMEMLARGVVDYVPLGVDETPDVLKAFSDLSDDFAIVPKVLIYYPLSSFPVVSNNQPELIERLRTGLEAMHADGSIGETGREIFDYEKPANCAVITLENPSRLFPLL